MIEEKFIIINKKEKNQIERVIPKNHDSKNIEERRDFHKRDPPFFENYKYKKIFFFFFQKI